MHAKNVVNCLILGSACAFIRLNCIHIKLSYRFIHNLPRVTNVHYYMATLSDLFSLCLSLLEYCYSLFMRSGRYSAIVFASYLYPSSYSQISINVSWQQRIEVCYKSLRRQKHTKGLTRAFHLPRHDSSVATRSSLSSCLLRLPGRQQILVFEETYLRTKLCFCQVLY